MILMLVVTVAVLTTLGFVKFKQVQTAIQASAGFQPPPEAVTSVVAKQEVWPESLSVIGSMEAVHGVVISADLPGTVSKINFQSGQAVKEGDVIVELDTRQERAQLAALEAQRDLAKINFGRTQKLVDEGVISRSEYDQAVASQKQTEANVGEIRATIERKTIRAPFSGILGIRKVNLGQYLAGGGAIVTLQALNPIYVNFGVPQQTASQIHVGRALHVTTEDLADHAFTGRVTAIDSVVDETTRNLQVQATLANPQAKLRPGMFVQVEVVMGTPQTVIALPTYAFVGMDRLTSVGTGTFGVTAPLATDEGEVPAALVALTVNV
jgi:membrane fusion protein (multidrug efflux system)